MKQHTSEIEMQRKYFADVSHLYDARVEDEYEHRFASSFLLSAIDHFGYQSVLDVGSGTGRALSWLRDGRPHLRVVGIEPVKELREIGYGKGLPKNCLIEGDATRMNFSDGAFDVVCEFGVLHHIRNSSAAVTEMLRVARKAIFISDSNNFGQGAALTRTMKQVLNAVGLWGAANFVKTRGKGYLFSEGDGVSYSYSVFNDYHQIQRYCRRIHVINTSQQAVGVNPYTSAGHVALLGILK